MEQKDWMIPSGVGVGSFALGVLVGHILTKDRLKVEMEKEVTVELDDQAVQLQFQFEELDKRLGHRLQESSYVFTKLIDGLAEIKDTSEIYLGRFTNPDEPVNEEEVKMNILDEDPPIVSIFMNGDDSDWNYDVELANRRDDIPYTIHRDEFFENEPGHRQSQLTYYKGDNILCDELDSPIYDPERVVGTLEFGRGSQDPNIVYVRNVKLDADYEVVLDHGFYQIEVLGQAQEDVLNSENLKHSVHKFRME
jgi:hypothetical protein